MTTTPPNPFNRSFMEGRRRNVARIDDMTAKDTTVSGRSLVNGIGEVLVTVQFPVSFGSRPVFTFGGELDENSTYVQGQFPRLSAVVVGWTTINRIVGAFDGYFTAATIAVVVEGIKGQNTWLHWNFHAPAIRNPVKILDDLTGIV